MIDCYHSKFMTKEEREKYVGIFIKNKCKLIKVEDIRLLIKKEIEEFFKQENKKE